MNLGKPRLEDLFNKQIKFRIPVFQRHYVWNQTDQWQPLWDDFINKYSERSNQNKNHPHYTGSIVLFQEATTTSSVSTYSVIDGQQRLTTFQLFVTAFREICRKHVGDKDLLNDLEKLLFNDKVYGQQDFENQKHKLVPTKFNNEEFKIILDNTFEEVEELLINPILNEYGFGWKTYRNEAKKRYRMLSAYLFFYRKIENVIQEAKEPLEVIIPKLLLTLKKDFQFVEINLDQNDDPQMIFETMNGRGASLTETDLIRNYVFMRANKYDINLDDVYDKYWDEFDNANSIFKWHDKTSRGRYYGTFFQFFIIDYLTLKLNTDIRYDQVFYQYKFYIVNKSSFQNIEEELKELNRFSSIFKKIVAPNKKTVLGRFASRLKDMGITTIYPLLLTVEGDRQINIVDKEKIYLALDSYVTRRFLCGYTTKNYNNVFLDFIKYLIQNKTAEIFVDFLKSKTGDSNLWPTDVIIKEKLLERPIYKQEKGKSKSLCNILLEIEKYKRGKKQEKIEFTNEGLTIEHLMPQKWYENWPLEDGFISKEEFEIAIHAVMTEEDPQGIYHKIQNRNNSLHSIGNLTILTDSLNPSISNNSFEIKKMEIAKQSTLKLNTYFLDKDNWDETEIKKRADDLLESVLNVWSY
jgi:uncharacterized protein with ParB-like and HNH nuclease domain